MKLVYKLLIPVVVVLVVIFIALYLIITSLVREIFISARADNLSALAKIKVVAFTDEDLSLDPHGPILQAKFKELLKLDPSIFRIKVWDKDLKIVYSDVDSSASFQTDNFINSVKSSFFENSMGEWSSINNPNLNTPEGKFGPFIVGTVPIGNNNGQTRYVAEFYSSAVLLLDGLNEFSVLVTIILGSAVVVVFVFEFFIFTRLVIRPILSLKRSAEIIGSGNLKEKAEIASEDEIGKLAESFNTMADALVKLYATLEEKVRLRTEEAERGKTLLEEKVTELEKINQLMTGRELKMIELKKEIENLKNKMKGGEAS